MKSNLPTGWTSAKVSDLSQTLRGVSYKKGNEQRSQTEDNCLILRGGNIQNGKVVSSDDDVYVDKGLVLEKQLLQQGDVVIVSSTGSVRLIGKAASVPESTDNVSFGAFLSMLRPKPEIDARLFGYFFQSAFYRNAIRELAAGININNIRNQYLEDLEFPLPPLAEQRRIVDQLDAAMQKLEASQERLEKLPELLKKFRQAVLAAAVSGKLTEAWRAEQGSVDSADVLINEIIEGRKIRFDKACALARFEGRKAPRRVFLEKHPDVNSELLPELPDSWTATTIGFLAHVTKLAGFEYTNYIKYEEQGEIPVVRAQNVQMGRFTEENLLYIDQKTSDFLERSQLHGREVLMVFIGAGTGNVCLAPKDRRWHLAPNVAKIDCDVISSEYLNYYLQSPVGLSNTLSFAKATAQPSLSMETIREIAVALPSLSEQQEIVRQVNHYFELADQLEARFEQAAALVEQLPQALLAKAFSGQLVPQDPADEPASELLARLRTEPATPATGKRGRKAKVATEAPLFSTHS